MNLNKFLTKHETSRLKWINIVGYEKAGKTKVLTEISKYIPTLYVDFEYGTKPYKGNFLHVSEQGSKDSLSIAQFMNEVVTEFPENKEYKVLVLDPFTGMTRYIYQALLRKFDVGNLIDYAEKGKGNGYTIYYEKVIKFLTQCMSCFDLIITVSHLKLSEHFINENKKISIADLDLMGQLKNYVKREADVNLTFSSRQDGEKFLTLINNDRHLDLIRTLLQSRDYEFVKRIHTDIDLIREICQMFNQPFDAEKHASLTTVNEINYGEQK